MEHLGVSLSPYVPHHIPILYDNKEVECTPEQEELVNAVALTWPYETKANKERWLQLYKQTDGQRVKMKDVAKINMNRVASNLIQKSMGRDAKAKEGYAIVDHSVVKVKHGDFNVSIQFKPKEMTLNVVIAMR